VQMDPKSAGLVAWPRRCLAGPGGTDIQTDGRTDCGIAECPPPMVGGIITTTPIYQPLFEDNLGTLVPER